MRHALHEFWEFAAFIANSLLFLLIGLNTAEAFGQINLDASLWGAIVWAIVASLFARAVVVYTLIPLVNRFRHGEPIDWRYQAISFWGGLRGAIAIALALNLAPNFPNRHLILLLTLAVVIFTILSSGTTMGRLIHALGLDRPSALDRLAEAETLVRAKRQGLHKLDDWETRELFSANALASLKQEYQESLEEAEQSLFKLWSQLREHPQQLRQIIWLEALSLERQAYQELYDQGIICETVLDRLKLKVNLKGDDIFADRIPPSQQLKPPSENGLERLMVGLTRWFIPRPKFIRQRRELALKNRYEYDLSITYVSAEVAKDIDSWAEEITEQIRQHSGAEGIDATVVEECARAYQQLSNSALQRVTTIEERSSEIAISLQQKIARQAALFSEKDAISQLLVQGAVSEKVATKAQSQIEI